VDTSATNTNNTDLVNISMALTFSSDINTSNMNMTQTIPIEQTSLESSKQSFHQKEDRVISSPLWMDTNLAVNVAEEMAAAHVALRKIPVPLSTVSMSTNNSTSTETPTSSNTQSKPIKSKPVVAAVT
jgi:hypothetical protein